MDTTGTNPFQLSKPVSTAACDDIVEEVKSSQLQFNMLRFQPASVQGKYPLLVSEYAAGCGGVRERTWVYLTACNERYSWVAV